MLIRQLLLQGAALKEVKADPSAVLRTFRVQNLHLGIEGLQLFVFILKGTDVGSPLRL